METKKFIFKFFSFQGCSMKRDLVELWAFLTSSKFLSWTYSRSDSILICCGDVKHRGSILASHPSTLGSIPGVPEKLSLELFDVAGIHWRCCFEWSGQRLENVNWTHRVLASGKLALQKNYSYLMLLFCLSGTQNVLRQPRTCMANPEQGHNSQNISGQDQ